jgi:transposase
MSLTDTTLVTRAVAGGIDWAEANHALCVIDSDGQPIERVTLAHSKAGVARLVAMLCRHQVQAVGIERPDGPVVDALFEAGITVYVIAPAQIKALRRRYGTAGNKDDRFDAYVLADTIRTDRRRLTPLERDSDATIALRQLCRTRKDLVAHRVAVANQLRAHLLIVLPAAVGLFSCLEGQISRQFLHRFANQDAVDWLTCSRLAAWLKRAGYNFRTKPDVLYQRLVDAPRGPSGPHTAVLAEITRAYVQTLTTICAQIDTLTEHISQALDAHPDKDIFTSLPKAGTVRAARLLAEIGDARGRFPTPTALACLSGVAPSTRESGTHRVVSFRWAVDKQLRDAVCDFAGDSHHANPWAADLYARARARGHDHPHAVRILGRAWLDIIWKCWTTNTPYDTSRHKALQRLVNKDQHRGD